MTLSRDDCEKLYRAHAAAAFRRAQRMLRNDGDADEVVHDVFLALFERPSQFRAQSSVSTYLYSAVTHACLNRLRTRRTRERLGRARVPLLPESDPGTRSEATAFARHLLAQLPPELAEIAVYHYFDELSQREIGRVMGRSHMHVGRLLERLHGWLERQELSACER